VQIADRLEDWHHPGLASDSTDDLGRKPFRLGDWCDWDRTAVL